MNIKPIIAFTCLSLSSSYGFITASVGNGTAPATLDTDNLVASSANAANSVGFTSSFAVTTGIDGTNDIDTPFTLNNFAPPSDEVVTTFGVNLHDLFDGTAAKTLTLTVETNLGNDLVLTIAEGSGNPTIGFSAVGQFNYTTQLNSGTAVTSTTPVTIGQNLETYFQFDIAATDGSEYFTSFDLSYSDPNGENAQLLGVFIGTTTIPEPSSALLSLFGLSAFLIRRKR